MTRFQYELILILLAVVTILFAVTMYVQKNIWMVG
jgi:hypothetical protein